MEYTILGTRGSVPVSGSRFATFGGATSSILLRMSGETFVLDAGSGMIRLAAALRANEKHINLLISHPHADHLIGFGMGAIHFNEEYSFDIYGKTREDKDVKAHLETLFNPPLWPVGPDGLKTKFSYHDLADEFMIGKVKVSCLEGNHPGGGTIYKLEGDATVVYATDCTLTEDLAPKLIQFAKNADVLFIDGQFSDEEWKTKSSFGHNSWNMAAEAGLKAGAGKTVIIHHDPGHDDRELLAAEQEARAINPNLEFGREELNGMSESQQLSRVLDMCIALSAERDREKLLSAILDSAMDFTMCDAGTLYLLEDDGLHFSRMVTKSQGVRQGGHESPITLPPVPLNENYASACAAIYNKSYNFEDVRICTDFDFSGPLRYDRMTGYRTQSMLIVPLTKDNGEVTGVMQLINAKNATGETIPFDKEAEAIITAVASQAAISITNMQYSAQIAKLLDSIVGALSTAIDERTPYNANHTRNMVKYAEAFLDWLDCTNNPWRFDANKRRTFLLSVWLHDVGKLVVPLEVMDKATRLGPNLERIESRIHEQELLAKIDFLEKKTTEDEYIARLAKLTEIKETVNAANTAGFLQDDLYEKVAALRESGLLTGEEQTQLEVRKGTLTAAERSVMESHVAVTKKILSNVDFPKMYKQVPDWAAAHHELLNGNGYPEHKHADDISSEVRLLTILDVFDALTARDRPYKPAMPVEKALSILHVMAEKEGSIDPEILKLFEESKAWEVIE